ncbi:hypothetical protein [Undibacterium umbellatum]|uniref:Uncharacterized protein n=1 Tax=Undibacterium umbellatum TaxID=2762300 RepID=A0ABR6Z9P1_9BURK|nr:hypothetical protein [Undibacterium umbellatum]MBC3908339.1 hypothetical protein [Undibacterium umbellatum]
MEKEGPLSERSEFRAFPFFVLHKREPPSGGDDAWVAFLAHLFWRDKKVGSCRSTTGRQFQNTCEGISKSSSQNFTILALINFSACKERRWIPANPTLE